MLVDTTATGRTGEDFALRLLEHGVPVMAGSTFGDQAKDFIRLSLTVENDKLAEAVRRMISYADSLAG